jgi:hypothetical protein
VEQQAARATDRSGYAHDNGKREAGGESMEQQAHTSAFEHAAVSPFGRSPASTLEPPVVQSVEP